LIILDGSKALHKAVTQTFGSAALIHRCHVHKLRNILEHLPEGQRPWVRAIARAYKQAEVTPARRLLQDLVRRLEDRSPSAAASVREGLDETLTVLTLNLSDRLRQSLATANAIDSLISRSRHVKRECETAAWRTDGVAMDRGRHSRSGEGLPPTETSQGYAEVRRWPSRSRSTARHRCVSAERRVECQPSRR
jgi:putative transposase